MVLMARPELMALTALASRQTEAMGKMEAMVQKVLRQLLSKVQRSLMLDKLSRVHRVVAVAQVAKVAKVAHVPETSLMALLAKTEKMV
jgi:hypothetical protein